MNKWLLLSLVLFMTIFLGLIKNTYASAKSTELFCLTEAIYFEARGEPLEGQLAVALVILNRQHDNRFPGTVCGVVRQFKQFSYYFDGLPEHVDDKKAWDTAERIAKSVYTHYRTHIRGTLHDITHGALFYFNPHLASPAWAEGMVLTRTIGDHVFLKPQETLRIYL